jgi:hypothetical protein
VFFELNLGPIAHNVPAVYDVLPARIRSLRSKDQGRQNVAEVLRGNGAQRNDLAKPQPEPPKAAKHIQSCYAQWRFYYYSIFLFHLL